MHLPFIVAINAACEPRTAADSSVTYVEKLPASAPRRLNGVLLRNPTKLSEAPETTDRS
jgi:hypothetical protein